MYRKSTKRTANVWKNNIVWFVIQDGGSVYVHRKDRRAVLFTTLKVTSRKHYTNKSTKIVISSKLKLNAYKRITLEENVKSTCSKLFNREITAL